MPTVVRTIQVGNLLADPRKIHKFVDLAKDGIGRDEVFEVEIQEQAGGWFGGVSKHGTIVPAGD